MHRFTVRLAGVLLAAALLLLGLGLGCPAPRHDDNFDDDAAGDDDVMDDDDNDTTGGYDNVGYCSDWLDSLDCGGFDFGTVVDCSVFDTFDCDLSDYFDCLDDEFICDGDMPDFSGWQYCADLASCD